jgi:hypothetical protein
MDPEPVNEQKQAPAEIRGGDNYWDFVSPEAVGLDDTFIPMDDDENDEDQ